MQKICHGERFHLNRDPETNGSNSEGIPKRLFFLSRFKVKLTRVNKQATAKTKKQQQPKK
jgi:hypothetical protein